MSTNKPRVLMLGPLSPPVGGMATVVQNLTEALQDRVELRVLNNVKTTAADRSLWQGIRSQLRLLGKLTSACVGQRPQAVHIHTCSWFTFWRNSVDVLLAKLLLRKVVLHIHGAEFHKFLQSLSPVKAWTARRVFGFCNRIVVLGENWREVLEPWADASKLRIVPNGVPVGAPVTKSTNRADDEPFRVICLANYEVRKGQADLIQAASKLDATRPIELQLFGFEAEPGQQAALEALAGMLGLGDQVLIPGPITGVDKDARMHSADAFCLPSYDEGLPMSMLEAMAIALPVITTRVGAIPEAVDDGREGLLYDAGDIDALQQHLERLMQDPDAARTIGSAGRERLIADFSLERSAELVLGVYRELAGD